MFGIDTLTLWSTDFKLSCDCGLTLEHTPTDLQTGALVQANNTLYNGDGFHLQGKKAYRNTDFYNVTLGAKGLFIQFSVPKVVNGNNDIPVDQEMTRNAIQKVQDDLKNNGVGVDLVHSSVSRMDLFKQPGMSNSFLDYVPVFNLLQGKRQNKRDYGTSFLYYNGQTEECFYDKDVERALKLGKKLDLSSTNVRGEIRIKAHRPISKKGYDTASDILKNYEGLQSLYVNTMKKVIKEPGQVGRSFLVQEDLVSEFEQLKARGVDGLKALREHVLFFGASVLLDKVTIENYIQTFLFVSDNKNKRDLEMKARNFLQRYSLKFTARSSTDVRKLYEELYLKFVA